MSCDLAHAELVDIYPHKPEQGRRACVRWRGELHLGELSGASLVFEVMGIDGHAHGLADAPDMIDCLIKYQLFRVIRS